MELITDTSLFLNRLTYEMQNLPGEQAHLDMIPFRPLTSKILEKPTNYRLSAVLIVIYFEAGTPHFILTERQNYTGKHGGQISLPGGKVEPSDRGTAETALRETEEEIGIEAKAISLLGNLTEVYIPVSNFLIHPYIGHISVLPELTPNSREVKSIIHCSLPDLLNRENRIITRFKTENGIWMKNIPAFNFNQKIVWGATAVILNEFKFILQRLVTGQ